MDNWRRAGVRDRCRVELRNKDFRTTDALRARAGLPLPGNSRSAGRVAGHGAPAPRPSSGKQGASGFFNAASTPRKMGRVVNRRSLNPHGFGKGSSPRSEAECMTPSSAPSPRVRSGQVAGMGVVKPQFIGADRDVSVFVESAPSRPAKHLENFVPLESVSPCRRGGSCWQ